MNFITRILIFFIVFIFCACDPCRNLDCITDRIEGQFRIVATADGRDLIFGQNKIYDIDQIRFYSVQGSDTTFFQTQAIRFPGAGYDSILYVRFFPIAEIAYMRLNESDTDTLKISYNTRETKCCGTVAEITNFRLNSSINIPGDNETQEIKK